MSAIENLMNEVQCEADRQQGEVIRRLTINYPIGGHVCDYQALNSRLRKLNKNLGKTDEYVSQLRSRIAFVYGKLEEGTYLHLTEMLVRRHQSYTDEECLFLERVVALVEDIARVKELIQQCVPCKVCIACKPRTTLRRTVKWRTKKTAKA